MVTLTEIAQLVLFVENWTVSQVQIHHASRKVLYISFVDEYESKKKSSKVY